MNPILKRIITALTVAAVVVCAILYAPLCAIVPAVCVLAALAVLEYAQLLVRKLSVRTPGFWLAFLGGSALLCAGLSALPLIAHDFACLGDVRHGNLMLLYVLAIVKISDMGGFAFGMSTARLMNGGNHKLCPSVSPNKSWEGLGGSVFGSCLVSCCFMPITGFGWGLSLLLGVTAALVGTFGDLVESKFKRWVGVKDSSTMKFTNGMGGVLDMLDSLLFAPGVIYLLVRLSV